MRIRVFESTNLRAIKSSFSSKSFHFRTQQEELLSFQKRIMNLPESENESSLGPQRKGEKRGKNEERIRSSVTQESRLLSMVERCQRLFLADRHASVEGAKQFAGARLVNGSRRLESSSFAFLRSFLRFPSVGRGRFPFEGLLIPQP